MNYLNQTMGGKEWGLLILLSILWGGSFFFVGIAVKALPPLTIVTLRVGLAALALHLVLWRRNIRMPCDKKLWRAFFAMGMLNNLLPFCLIVWGQTHIASGLASIFNAMTPIFTVLIAHVFTRDERLTGVRLAGVLVGLSGVAIIMGLNHLGSLGTNSLAQLAVLGAALSYACAGVYGRRFKRLNVAPLVTATGQVTASSLLLAPLALVVDHPWRLAGPDWGVWAAIISLALISTALAYLIYFRLLATAGATNLLLVTFLIPISAIFLGAIFLGEQLSINDFSGMLLICLGLAAIDGRLLASLCKKASSFSPI